MAAVTSGITFFIAVALAAVLLVGAVQKIRSRATFEWSLVQLLPARIWRAPLDSRRMANVVIAAEVLLAAALVLAPDRQRFAVAGVAAGTFALFLLVLVRSHRKNVPCGCFGNAYASAGSRGLMRGTTFLLAAVVLMAMTANGSETSRSTAFSLGAFLALIVGAVLISARPIAVAYDESGSEGVSRRRFIAAAGVFAGALLLMGDPLVGRSTLQSAKADPRMPGDCSGAYDDCIMCAAGDPVWAACCSGCRIACQAGVANQCEDVDCNGHWINPGTTN